MSYVNFHLVIKLLLNANHTDHHEGIHACKYNTRSYMTNARMDDHKHCVPEKCREITLEW